MSTAAGPEVRFSEARSRLSGLLDEVVHQHHAKIIDRSGGDRALLIDGELVEQILGGNRFEPEVIADEGEMTARLPGFGLLGAGGSVGEAIEDLTLELDRYADRFLSQYEFYRQTDSSWQLPYLLRFKLTPPGQRLPLLLEDSRHLTEGAGQPA